MSVEQPFKINRYDFNVKTIELIKSSNEYFEKNLWPLVYILKDEQKKLAYVGETTDTIERMKAHLKNEKKQNLSEAFLISSNRFNKSATLDIESNLIKYISAEGEMQLINGNIGIANHHYFQQRELYESIFEGIWEELLALKVVRKTLKEIDNSDLFKYSPYKALSVDQILSLKEILRALASDKIKNIMVHGGAGTGKSVLAIFLFKLLNTDLDTFKFSELGPEEQEIIDLVKAVKFRYPNLKMGLVIPMSSFRKTVAKIFASVKGLERSWVLGPGDVAKQTYDILLVDESHRLRRRVNLGTLFGSFDKNSQRLGLDPHTTSELQWVLHQSSKDILFYDAGQSIRPSDVQKAEFDLVCAAENTSVLKLKTQLRSKGGNELVDFIKALLQIDQPAKDTLRKIDVRGYELFLFDSLWQLREELEKREKSLGLCRLVAGYAWPWTSKKDKSLFDIELDGVQLRWNTTSEDWINSVTAASEVGCIHTVQGYDLNYVGVIFGPEITFDETTGLIEVNKENYKDRTGKSSIRDQRELHEYILNIYSTLILRGIKGAFIYVSDSALKAYFARYMELFSSVNAVGHKRKIPLIHLEIEQKQLIEVSKAAIEVDVSDIINGTERVIACQINKTAEWDNDPSLALFRIVHEEQEPVQKTASDPTIDETLPQGIWYAAEQQVIYEKRSWLPKNLSLSRFVTMKLKKETGEAYIVVARFEKLLSEI